MDSDVEAALEQAEAYFEESRDRTVEDGSPRRTKRRRAESTTSAEISPVEHDLGRWGSLRMQVMPTPTDLWLRAWREQNKEPEEPAYLAMDGELDFDLLQLFSPRFVRPCRGPEDRREEKDDVVACVEAEFADRMNEDQILALLDRVRYAVENAALLDPAEIEAVRGMEEREWCASARRTFSSHIQFGANSFSFFS